MPVEMFIHWKFADWTELTCINSTQLHDAFVGHARQRHDLTGCSETRTVRAQQVLDTRGCSHWSLRTGGQFSWVQFVCCEHSDCHPTLITLILTPITPTVTLNSKKGKGFPYSLPSVGPGADLGVQAVSAQVTWSESRHRPGSRLPLLSAMPAVTSVAFTRWRYL